MATNQALLDYIQNQIRKGYTISSVKDFLIKQGYNLNEVNSAIAEVHNQRIASIKSYADQEVNAGTDINTVKNKLKSYGYTAEEINKAVSKKSAIPAIPKIPTPILIGIGVLIVIAVGLYFIAKPTTDLLPGDDDEPVDTGFKPPVEVDDDDYEKPPEPEPVTPAPAPPPEEEIIAGDKPYKVINATDNRKIQKAIEMCEKTANEIYRDACFDQLAKATRDHSLCASITDSVQKDKCYKRTAIYIRDQKICDYIADPRIKSDCQLYEYV
ncbi:hypothetical protein ACFL96_12070 [Thermoproteota archaeon]